MPTIHRQFGIASACELMLGNAAAWPIHGLIKHSRPELERRIGERVREAAE